MYAAATSRCSATQKVDFLQNRQVCLNFTGFLRWVHDLADLSAHKDKVKAKILGIEPGNDGNRLLQTMIDRDAFGLKDWKLVESSEKEMLGEVGRAVKKKKRGVFWGWEPHPMNANIEMAYLAGGDDYFGPDFGGTTVRKGYLAECPNSARLLDQGADRTRIQAESGDVVAVQDASLAARPGKSAGASCGSGTTARPLTSPAAIAPPSNACAPSGLSMVFQQFVLMAW